MAGLDPAISCPVCAGLADHRTRPGEDGPALVLATVGAMRGGWVYILTNRPNGTLYVGVTSNLSRRAWEHREGVVKGFTSKYRLKRLVWFERHEDIRSAIRREKNLKHWSRAWKIDLIVTQNPEWDDLSAALG